MIRIDIVNDCTGDEIVGNYDVYLSLPSGEKGLYGPVRKTYMGRVEHHTRSNGWDSLVYLAVKALQQQMKGGDNMTIDEKEEGSQEITIRFSANGTRQDVLNQVGNYLRGNTETHGLDMKAIELNGEQVSSDEVMSASNDI